MCQVLTLLAQNDVTKPSHLKGACAEQMVFSTPPSAGKRVRICLSFARMCVLLVCLFHVGLDQDRHREIQLS